ncbi:MAG: NAD-dependent DNA ligase LigA [Lachnospiraceae bacterium]|nr:NAD-dependent DNA ligase LigA [Lachnospiraceae bacterium]MCI8827098.1 NAD-dependent DNA ligase LigA [Lachnospiraceae bacterium]
MNKKLTRIRELIDLLNQAGRAYYQESREIMSNLEYDRLYDELGALEKETGMVYGDSPTVNVGYEVVSELPKETHESPMLSLDKTKSVQGLADFLGDKKGILSWKLDGLTVVLTYNEGKLVKAVTRGNGQVGEVITNNARVFKNIPVSIPFQGELILRGEAVIKYSDFEKINQTIEDADAKYKNPRNLCSGSVRQLNNKITSERNVNFFAFTLVRAENADFENSMEKQFEFLTSLGFSVVEYQAVTGETVEQAVAQFAEKIEHFDIPSDGLVLIFDDLEYGRSLGSTSKFPRNGIAFKWADETAKTTLLEMEWSPSRTGLINPVAIFEPVELEGTTVSRASVHNISIVEGLELGIGDEIEIYKANMIIPQIAENHTRSNKLIIPDKCPACNEATEIRQVNDVKSLYCTNPECVAKKIKKFTLFVSRDALNIDGLSEETLEKLIDRGFIHSYADIFKLERYEEEIVNMYGFGRRSYNHLQDSVNHARNTELHALIYALGIPNIGLSNAKMICRAFDYDIEKVIHATKEDLMIIEGIGEVIADAYIAYFQNEKNQENLKELLKELKIAEPEKIDTDSKIAGKVFVITGSVEHFANRNELKALIESKGGKVTGSVTSKTDYLINNDVNSNSSKNKKARELEIPILSEEDFLKLASMLK